MEFGDGGLGERLSTPQEYLNIANLFIEPLALSLSMGCDRYFHLHGPLVSPL